MKYISIILLLLVSVFPLAARGETEDSEGAVSGRVEGGLRIIEIEDGNEDLDFTIYRGDYIVFNFKDGRSRDFSIPELDISEVMPKPASEKPYVKMKKSGSYSFTLGEYSGVFNVLELEDANYHEMTAAEAADLIKNVNPLIIDVRTPGEYESGHLPGASLLPVQIFAENISSIEKYKDDDILLYCASGNRSTVASRMLIDAGFTKVYNLRYGIGDWARKGLPVE